VSLINQKVFLITMIFYFLAWNVSSIKWNTYLRKYNFMITGENLHFVLIDCVYFISKVRLI